MIHQRHVSALVRVAVSAAGTFLFLAGAARAAEGCPAPPPPVRNLDVPRFYGDDAGSVIDPKSEAAHKAAVAPLTAYLRYVSSETDKALRRDKPEQQTATARCALDWLTVWAKGGAWLGTMATRQAEYQRKWDLAGAALSYLKLKRFASPEQRAAIEPWLRQWADRTRAFFDDPARQRNNHWYWLGLGLAATGSAADSPKHWESARAIMGDAAKDIAADGTLAKEMERRARVLHYHAFAVTPLVVMAEMAAARGEDWYALENGALHRLVATTLGGLKNPDTFDRRIGTAQERPINPHAGWLALYQKRFPEKVAPPVPPVPNGHRWLGGDVLLLSAALTASTSP
jgi:poly(beta-D-mannuronate) lyase